MRTSEMRAGIVGLDNVGLDDDGDGLTPYLTPLYRQQ